MDLQRFSNVTEAERWYENLAGKAGGEAEILLALCRGEDARAEALYKETSFPRRWWADICYMQGHYLIRLRRRDRLFRLAAELGIDMSLFSTTPDPWTDLESMARTMDTRGPEISKQASVATLQCFVGHIFLAMDFHEKAVAAYEKAIALDASVWIPWENTKLLEFSRQ